MRQIVIPRLIFGTMLFGVCNANHCACTEFCSLYASQKAQIQSLTGKMTLTIKNKNFCSVVKTTEQSKKGVYFLFLTRVSVAKLVNPLTETNESVGTDFRSYSEKPLGLTYKKVSSGICDR